MNEINPAKLNKTNFKGMKNMNKEIKSLENCIKSSLTMLRIRAEREVAEYGDFAPVYEQFANPDKSLCATDFMLKISKPPKNIEGHEKIRNLEVVAYKLPHPYKAERIIAAGNKEEILKQLKSDEVYSKIESAVKSLSHDLEDI